MKARYELPSDRSGRRYRRVFLYAMAASVVIHGLILLLWGMAPVALKPSLPVPGRPMAVVAPGGSMLAVAPAEPRRIEIPPPPNPRLVLDAPEVETIEIREMPPAPPAPLALSTGGSVPGSSGNSDGPAEGDGGGQDEVTAPMPRSLLPQWDAPDEVRGMRVTVRVFVDASGRPTGEVQLRPPTPNRGFNRKLIDNVRRMEYYPARRNGTPVPGWAEITFVF